MLLLLLVVVAVLAVDMVVMAVAVVVGAEVLGAEVAAVVSSDDYIQAATFGLGGDVCIILGRLFLFLFLGPHLFVLFSTVDDCFSFG